MCVDTRCFSSWNVLEYCQNQLTTNVRVYFWTLNYIPLIYMSIFMEVPHCLDYGNFVVGFEIGNCVSLTFSSFPKLISLFLVPWISIWILGSVCQFLGKKRQLGFWPVIKFAWNLHQFGMYCHLNNSRSSHPWAWDLTIYLVL